MNTQNMDYRTREASIMKRFLITGSLLASLLALVGCNESGKELDRVQTNLVDKSIFQGEWWYSQTVVGVDGDEARISGTFEGEMAMADLGVDGAQSLTVARIRWVIDEGYLFAYRAYELIDGGNDDGREAEFRGQPLAAFAIEGHVDVQRDYSPVTGEVTNVRVENDSDRRWYERNFVRVDWSRNLMTSFYYLNGVDLFNQGRRESAPFFFQPGAHPDFPASYAPQYVRIGDDPDYKFRDEWPAGSEDTVHYMSFVTQEVYSPGADCLFYDIPCQTVATTVRNSFLRVPPEHAYAVETQSHDEFDRFGTFRTYQRTYVRGGTPLDTLRDRCESDADCGTGGLCDAAQHICIGGLTGDYGETDFLTFYRPLHNFFRNALTDTECTADWHCDGRFDDTAGRAGSVCDRSARRCTVPTAERETRQVTYHLNPGFPAHLVPKAFEIVGEWNEAFMRGWRGVRGMPAPEGPAVACQNDIPTNYCYCGSPEDLGDGTCRYKYDPFQPPAAAMAAGVANPYDCHITNTAGFTDPARPTSFADYPTPAVYNYQFEGAECLLVLRSNSCDATPGEACEDLGDLRYQFFNYIPHGNLYFGGVAIPLVDPTTGEFISSNANMAGESIESVGTTAIQLFPVYREEPGAAEAYFEGEVTRDYFENLGLVERPTAAAASGTDGVPGDDRGRPPGLPVDLHDHLSSTIESRLERIESLHGADGRARIMSDRIRNLAGTPHERRAVAALGPEGLDLLHATRDVSRLSSRTRAVDEDMLDAASPFRGNFLSSLYEQNDVWRTLGRYNIDPPLAPEIRSSNWRYWAEVFRDRPAGEASIRMQQAFLGAVMLHEVGHAVGLRHNFGGSLDRDNYYDGYFNVVVGDDLALPQLDEFDLPRNGGDANGFVAGEEVNNYLSALRRVRDERSDRGLGNTMGASIMDYHGDLSDLSGLGRYDVAATVWSHFNVIEAYNGDPRLSRGDSLNQLTDAANTTRTFWTYYNGGESCDEDTDCPHGEGTPTASGQPVFQRCIKNPRNSRLPAPCGGDRSCICSSLDEDFLDYVDGVAFNNDVDGDGAIDHYPVNYLFCTDDRTNDISWCNRFDAGETFQEMVDHFRRAWTQGYPLSYYRRFRNTSLRGQASYTWILLAAKIYQHLFFRYFYEPGFRDDTGPLGFDDQYLASVDSMNWLTEMVTLPESGHYRHDATRDVFEYLGPDAPAGGSDFELGVGQGFPMYSKYQEGFYGFFRRERAGVYFDKLLALMALTRRDWNLSFTIDERYFINFYDLFPVEMTEFFGGAILDDPHWFAPRVDNSGPDPIVQNLSWWRGSCSVDGLRTVCRGPQPDVYAGTPVDGTINDVLRFYSAVYALSEFPVYYDTSFEQRLLIFKRDAGESFDVPDTQPDGDTTCAYGGRLTSRHDLAPAECDEADYALYRSDRFHTEYMAVKVRPRLTYNLEEEQLGFQLLRRMIDKQEELRRLRRIADPTPAELALLHSTETSLVKDESFLELLIDLQRIFGITSYF